MSALALSLKNYSSEYQIRGHGYSEWHENEGSFTFPGKGRVTSFDRATVRLETLSSPTSDPKKVFASLTSARTCPPSAYPSWFLLGQISGTRSSLVHCVVLGHIQQIRCRSNFAIPRKAYQGYKASNHIVYLKVQHISSNMQSHPHDASRSYSYQRHHQTSLSPSHHPNCVDYSGHHSTSAVENDVVQDALQDPQRINVTNYGIANYPEPSGVSEVCRRGLSSSCADTPPATPVSYSSIHTSQCRT